MRVPLRSIVSVVLGGALLVAPSVARADDVDDLLKKLNDGVQSLSTDDCTTACRALESMGRAAERICTLDPGPRCVDARDKVESARKRVRHACPTCVSANVAPTDTGKPAAPPPPSPGADTGTKGSETVQASAPPSEQKRGGCAGCRASDRTTDLGGVCLAVTVGIFLVARRRRHP